MGASLGVPRLQWEPSVAQACPGWQLAGVASWLSGFVGTGIPTPRGCSHLLRQTCPGARASQGLRGQPSWRLPPWGTAVCRGSLSRTTQVWQCPGTKAAVSLVFPQVLWAGRGPGSGDEASQGTFLSSFWLLTLSGLARVDTRLRMENSGPDLAFDRHGRPAPVLRASPRLLLSSCGRGEGSLGAVTGTRPRPGASPASLPGHGPRPPSLLSPSLPPPGQLAAPASLPWPMSFPRRHSPPEPPRASPVPQRGSRALTETSCHLPSSCAALAPPPTVLSPAPWAVLPRGCGLSGFLC